jgi:hypothetical protein
MNGSWPGGFRFSSQPLARIRLQGCGAPQGTGRWLRRPGTGETRAFILIDPLSDFAAEHRGALEGEYRSRPFRVMFREPLKIEAGERLREGVHMRPDNSRVPGGSLRWNLKTDRHHSRVRYRCGISRVGFLRSPANRSGPLGWRNHASLLWGGTRAFPEPGVAVPGFYSEAASLGRDGLHESVHWVRYHAGATNYDAPPPASCRYIAAGEVGDLFEFKAYGFSICIDNDGKLIPSPCEQDSQKGFPNRT